MSNLYRILVFALLCSFSITILAQKQSNEDDNIIITDKKETYEYKLEGNQVVIKSEFTTHYISSKRSGRITVYEMYDNESEINKVKIKGIKGVKPEYNMYSSNNIFYSDAKICHFNLNFEKIGQTATVEFEKTYKDPRYFTSVYLSEPESIRSKTVQIIVPSWMNVEFNEYNFGDNVTKKIDVNQKDNSRVYTYTIKNEAAMKNEPMMQGRSFISPHILVLNKSATINGDKTTYFETLADLYAWYHKIVGSVNNDYAIIATKAKEITKDCKTDIDKIKATYAWVQENIRYIAFEDGIAGFKPDDAQEVLRKKYGDCKGMANLVKILLETQGFDARLAWIGTNHIAYDYSSPALSVDNHMICALFYDNQTYYLDPTIEYMPLGEYPQTIQGRQVLIENKDAFILNRVPEFSPQLNTDSVHCEFRLVDGALTGKINRTFMGESKQVILSLINATPKNKLDEAIKSFAENHEIQDKASDVKLIDANPQSFSTTLSYTINKKSGVEALDNEYYIDLNSFKDFMTSAIDIKERVNNFLFSYKHHRVRNITLNIPENYKIDHTPKDFSLIKDKYEFKISYLLKNNQLTYKSEITIKDPLIRKEDFTEWNKDINDLKRNYLEQIVLIKK